MQDVKLIKCDDYRYSFLDGMYANVYGTLTGGVFLTGFALFVGMNEMMIGLMMAAPFIVTLFQLPCSSYICRHGGRKSIAYRAATLARTLWLPIVILGFLPLGQSPARQWLIVLIYLVLQAATSISYIAWISWTSDLVPDEIRGTFFGTRNMLCGGAGIAALLIFGHLTDVAQSGWGASGYVFAIPFSFAVLSGWMSSHYLDRVNDLPAPPYNGKRFFQELGGPLGNGNFRRYLFFTFCWNFSVYLSAPFFALYYLRDLGYSYGFVALLTTIAAVLDLVGMRVWGRISDRVKNKAVLQLCGWGVVFLPALWVFVRPTDILVPVLIQILGGGFWSGVALCANNLLLRISPREERVWYISTYSIAAGLGAALAPIIGGLLLGLLNDHPPGNTAGGLLLLPMHYLFIGSTVLRMLSLLLFQSIQEPQGKSLRETIQMLAALGRPGFAVNPALTVTAPREPAPPAGRGFLRLIWRRVAREEV